MRKIVVGVDGSAESHMAMQWALQQARCLDAEIVGVHVYTYTMPDVPDSAVGHPETIEEVVRNAEQRAAKVVERAVEAAGDLADGVTVTPRVIRGREPPEHILRECEDADLLVLGSRGLGGFAKLLIGSVSQKCIDYAHCTVMIVRAPLPGHEKAAA